MKTYGKANKADVEIIEPNYSQVARYFAQAFVEHAFDRFAKGPMSSFIEQIRYLCYTDPKTIEQMIKEFSKK